MKYPQRSGEFANYRITVLGHVSPRWADHLGLSIVDANDSDRPHTTLRGPVLDQAALMGILSSLYGMGFPLLAVECESQFWKGG